MPITAKDKELRRSIKKSQRDLRKNLKAMINESSKNFAKKDAIDIALSEYNLKKSAVKKRIEISKATTQNLKSVVYFSRSAPNAVSYKGTRQTKKGLNVEFKKGKRFLIPSAFIANKNGIKFAAIREKPEKESDKKYRKGQGAFFTRTMRYPVKSVTGPSLGYMIETSNSVDTAVSAELDDNFEKIGV